MYTSWDEYYEVVFLSISRIADQYLNLRQKEDVVRESDMMDDAQIAVGNEVLRVCLIFIL